MAMELRKLYRSGIDPVAQKVSARLERQTIPTFRQAATTAHEELVAGWRNCKHRKDWLSSLRAYAFPSLGSIRIDLIDAPMVRDLLLPIWLEKPETARRVCQRVRSVMVLEAAVRRQKCTRFWIRPCEKRCRLGMGFD
jgi:hypothetical protein